MTPIQASIKRTFDLVAASIGLLLTGWIILIAYVAASIDTRASGFFRQERVGMGGRAFTLLKLRTMREISGLDSTVTVDRDPRITPLGRWLRRLKIDELPQLVNVLRGEMSFVGPRPDVRGFADQLVGEDRLVLSVRPGITGPATLFYRNEEQLLAGVSDPIDYNRRVIYPHKVSLNLHYIRNYRFADDLMIIWKTLVPAHDSANADADSKAHSRHDPQ